MTVRGLKMAKAKLGLQLLICENWLKIGLDYVKIS